MGVPNKFLISILAATIGLMLPANALAEPIKLEEGTPVHLTLLDPVSSGHNHEGDPVKLRVVEDILASDDTTILIKAGTPAWGIVTLLQPNGMVGRKGEISLAIQGTKSVDGKTVLLRGNINREGASKLVTVVALAAMLPLPGMFFLLIKGSNAKIASGMPLTAYIDRNVLVEIRTDAPTAAAVVGDTLAVPVNTTVSESQAVPNYLQKYFDHGAQTDSLKALEQLLGQGVLTQAEFDTKKKTLLDRK